MLHGTLDRDLRSVAEREAYNFARIVARSKSTSDIVQMRFYNIGMLLERKIANGDAETEVIRRQRVAILTAYEDVLSERGVV